MYSPQNRRVFLQALAGGAAGISFSYMAPRAWSQNAGGSIASTRLTDNISLFSAAGSNVVVLTTADGIIMVDGGSPAQSGDLLKAVCGDAPISRIQAAFNTHWHLEHTGSNDALGKAGVKIIAHENTKLWMGAEIICQWQKKTYTPRPKEARPNQTFYTTGKLTFGNEEIRYGHLGQAHTDGDIYVFFANANILVTGDVFSVGSYPILDYSTGGWIGGLSDATKTLAGLTDARTRIIPGSGPVQSRDQLQAQVDMSGTMRTRFIDMMRKGMSAKQMLDSKPTKEFDEKWGNPELFIGNAYPGLWNHVREIGGIV